MNEWLGSALLAIIQGATEFLPISSSGHLAIAERLMGMGSASLVEDVVLHLGTLCAVVVFYRREIARLLRELFSGDRSARSYVLRLIAASVPAALVGLTLKDWIEAAFSQTGAVFAALAITGLMLWTTRGRTRVQPDAAEPWVAPAWPAALLMGCAQALAIFPGLSRSGWTVGVAIFAGVPVVAAARFSFLMSIPAIFGAAILTARDLERVEISTAPLLFAFVLAAAVGLLCLGWLLRLLRSMALHRFAPYLWGVALLGAIWLRLG